MNSSSLAVVCEVGIFAQKGWEIYTIDPS